MDFGAIIRLLEAREKRQEMALNQTRAELRSARDAQIAIADLEKSHNDTKKGRVAG